MAVAGVNPGRGGMRHRVSNEGQAAVQLFTSEFLHLRFSGG